MEKLLNVITKLGFTIIIISVIMLLGINLNRPESMVEKYNTEIESISDSDTIFIVTATVYNPLNSQCDSTPLITADGSKIDINKLNKGEIKWIAISRDLLNYFKYGDKVILSNEDGSICGIYEIHDTMNHRYKNKIDILFPETKKLGKWCNVEMRKVG